MKTLVVLVLIGAMVLTQHWHDWDAGHKLGGDDAASYLQIAQAAPRLAAEPLPFHHAQRMAGPYLAGLVAGATGADARSILKIATGACLLLAIFSLAAALARVCLPNREFALCLSLFVLHFSLRYYLVAPGMLPDALFVAGLALALYGLVKGNLAITLSGIVAAAAGRQTALLILPGMALWVLCGERWIAQSAARKGVAIVAATGAVAADYSGTAALASMSALPSENLAHLTGLAAWLASPGFSAGEFGTFLAYGIFPLLLPLTAIAVLLWRTGLRATKPELWSCLLMGAAIAGQPLLAGPEISGANAVRLAALGLAPLVLAAALLVRHAGHPADHWKYRAPLGVLLLFAASLHYNYTRAGPQTQITFAVLHLAFALCLGALFLAAPSRR